MHLETEAVWKECLQIIRDNISPPAITVRRYPPRRYKQRDSQQLFTVEVRSRFIYEWLEQHYNVLMNRTVTRVLGPQAKLFYKVVVVDQQKDQQPAVMSLPAPASLKLHTAAPKPATPPPAPPESMLNTQYSFDNFIEGDCNRLPRGVAMKIAENPGSTSLTPS